MLKLSGGFQTDRGIQYEIERGQWLCCQQQIEQAQDSRETRSSSLNIRFLSETSLNTITQKGLEPRPLCDPEPAVIFNKKKNSNLIATNPQHESPFLWCRNTNTKLHFKVYFKMFKVNLAVK